MKHPSPLCHALPLIALVAGGCTHAPLAGALPGAWALLAAVLAGAVLAWGLCWRSRALRGVRDTERQLAESTRFRQMIEGSNAVAWEFDAATGLCTYVSPQVEVLLGFPRQAWSGIRFWRENLHPEDRAFVAEFFAGQAELGFDHELEYRMLHADGGTIFVRDMRTLHRNTEGKVLRIGSLLIDLTAHKATEAALDDSESRFRSTFDQAAVGMAMYSLAGRYLRVNRRYAEICGRPEADLLDTDWRSLAPEGEPWGNEPLPAALSEGGAEAVTRERCLQRPDGSLVWVHATVSVVRSMRREPSLFMEVIEDITARKQSDLVLRDNEARLRQILASLDEGIVMRAETGEVLALNDAAVTLYGVPREHFEASRHDADLVAFLHADGRPRTRERLPMSLAASSGKAARDVAAVRRPDGALRWLQIKSEPVEGHGGGRAVVTTLTDVSRQRETAEELRLAATVFDNSVEAILVADAEQRILRVNPAFSDVTGYAPDEVIGESIAMLASGRHDEAFYADVWQAIAQHGYWQGEMWNTRKGGKVFPEWLSISAVRDENGDTTHYVAVFSDITERKANEARINYLAHHDPLTGLPNRALLQDRLEQALARAQRERSMVGLLFLDLDRFKTINDSLGHHAGDRLLRAVAERIRECVRESDTVCRQGGDEFIIVLQDVSDPEAPARVAEKILKRLAEPFEIDGHRIGTSFSIGIAVYPTDGGDPASLLRNADTAMYHAKAGGRNTSRFFNESMNATAYERLQIESALRQAVERDEFMLYFQPQVRLSDGQIVGAEALIRWNAPQMGFVSPARFIPIAEECGLIVRIGEWVLREACRQAQAWSEAGLPQVTMAVNISALQFRRDDLARTVTQALADTGWSAAHLELELTETLLMENAEEVMATIKRIKALGVRLSIDDFGTGYSSLAYLKRLAVDRLKIDQSFVRDVPKDAEDSAIVTAIIQLGQSLKLDVIAEGAETAAQVEFLTRAGCREAQGYYYCPPVTAEVFSRLLRNRAIGPRAVPNDPPAVP